MRKSTMSYCLTVALASVLILPMTARAQEMIIEPTDLAGGDQYLNEIIAGDTTATGERNDPDRVYVLRRNGIYLINDDIRANGFSLRMRTEEGDGARAIIYPVINTATGGFPDPIVDMAGDVWLKDLIMPGYTDAIPEEVANITSTIVRTTAPGFRLEIDNVIMSNTRGQHIRTESAAEDVIVTNSVFANMGDLGRSNFGAGKAIDLRDGSVDTLLFQNCTFVNFQDRIIRHRSSTAAINHLIFDHNTVVNGMSYHGTIALGWMGGSAQITNNLFVDPMVSGADINDAERQAEFDENGELFENGNPRIVWIFSVPNDSTEWTVANNYYTTSAEVQAFLDSWASEGVLGPGDPLSYHINSRLDADSVNAFVEVPGLELANRPDVMIDMATWYRTETGLTKETTNFVREDDDFDRRPVEYFMNEFDASYPTDSPAYTGADGGYPAGDLNWFPDRLAAWQNDPSVDVEEERELASGFVLEQNYPNPFNPTTNISYSLPQTANVSLRVFNVLGQEVALLIDGLQQVPGQYTITWDGTDRAGMRVPSGTYLYRLEAGNTVVARTMVLVK